MKIKKILIPLATATSSVAVVAPMVGCSCSTVALDLENIKVKDIEVFAITGNFNAGTSYEFKANLKTWKTDHQKPSEWAHVTSAAFAISSTKDTAPLSAEALDISKVKIIVDGKELKKASTEEEAMKPGYWTYMYDSESFAHGFAMVVENSNPVKSDSQVNLANIKFKQNTNDVAIGFTAQEGK